MKGWATWLEVTYSMFAERGSIDVLAVNAALRTTLVVEVKTEIASAEAIGRKLDEKGRLAPEIVRQRLGWTPEHVGRVLVLPESPRLRRLVNATPVLALLFPDDARRLRGWLRRPDGWLSAVWFLSGTNPRTARRVEAGPQGGPRRVASSRPDQPGASAPPRTSDSRLGRHDDSS